MRFSKVLLAIVCTMILFLGTGCDEADVASENLKKGADNFEILRKVIFYNGITDEYMYAYEGYCSINVDEIDSQLELTCKRGPETYSIEYLGLSDNVTYMVLQIEDVKVDAYHYRVILRPEVLLPSIEVDIE